MSAIIKENKFTNQSQFDICNNFRTMLMSTIHTHMLKLASSLQMYS